MQFAAHDFVLRKCALSRKLPLDLCNVRIIIRIPTTHTHINICICKSKFYAFAALIFDLIRSVLLEIDNKSRMRKRSAIIDIYIHIMALFCVCPCAITLPALMATG